MQIIPPQFELDLSNASGTTLATGGALALGVILATHHLLKDKKGVKPRKIHRPDSTLPILGNALDVSKGHQFHDWMVEQSLKFNNEPWMWTVPGSSQVVVCTPEAFEEVTITQQDVFIKGKFQIERIEHLLGRGLVASDGERWHRQRKAGVKFFSSRTLRAFMTQAMKKNMGQVQNVMENSIKTGEQVDLHKLFHDFTMQTFMEMGVGIELDWIGRKEPNPFEVAVDKGTMIVNRRFRIPEFQWKLERYLNVGEEKILAGYLDTIYSFMNRVVQESLDRVTAKKANDENTKPIEGKDVIKSVVELFVEQSADAEGLRPEDLVEFLLTFVLAARDTTALTLAWFFYELSRQPEIEEKIRKELAEKLNVDKDTYLTTEHARELTYMEAVIKETLRYYPAGPYTMRQATKDTVICGDIFIKKGQVVGLSTVAMNRNPDVWGPDAHVFKPERWIDPETGNIINMPAHKFFTFGAGPRACIGMSLAMMELRVIIANLIHKYRFDVDPSNDGSYFAAIALNMQNPLFTNVRRA
ncbi:hypothetical protein Poli38472_008236 [Pythium oligandrum]|uniref:Cytochrome P450 n=1 Tax=Pythium oligandrum TaxID=41045 RepID=A0A8K1FLT9_PYTOL|nr:hypothetical protein Poli38472_008236 [Pythium oligandrum]|eukprot:TMW65594.1 hypothetical protein Poli38472_008236 [Pythium oligandrum]